MVRLAAEEIEHLQGLIHRGRVAAYRRKHAQVLLLVDEGQFGNGLIDREVAPVGFIPGSDFLNLQTSLSEAALHALVDPDQEILFHCEGMR